MIIIKALCIFIIITLIVYFVIEVCNLYEEDLVIKCALTDDFFNYCQFDLSYLDYYVIKNSELEKEIVENDYTAFISRSYLYRDTDSNILLCNYPSVLLEGDKVIIEFNNNLYIKKITKIDDEKIYVVDKEKEVEIDDKQIIYKVIKERNIND